MSPLPKTISALAFMKDSWPSCMCWKMSSASSLSGYCTEIRSLKKLKTDCLNLSSTLSRTRFVWGSHSSYSHLYEMIRFGCNKCKKYSQISWYLLPDLSGSYILKLTEISDTGERVCRDTPHSPGTCFRSTWTDQKPVYFETP